MAFSMSGLNSSELQSVGASLSQDAENYGNSKDVELRWAMKAMDHATVHYNLISSVDASRLRLTKIDDKIYKQFREEFPDFDVANIKEDDLKTPEAKQKWRNFCESFKGEVEDYNMGTLLRLRCEDDYSPETTTFSVRTQFLAIEIARNKEGHNSILLKKEKEKKQQGQT
ncbi:polysaccharide biosynthesis domain containing 1 [Plakobranchus ocellatus]|uniref:Polysaccharide biosynthesis domain containing 1 n=1 Tax=Plakobranchus ocellatus TaxID=259542 RepID=A0AAV4DD02_9GAST|nr:polysaccharide biosynthesis domain containing 1 [Plakobranchus ocellatus]